jgi:hypothetical protein
MFPSIVRQRSLPATRVVIEVVVFQELRLRNRHSGDGLLEPREKGFDGDGSCRIESEPAAISIRVPS